MLRSGEKVSHHVAIIHRGVAWIVELFLHHHVDPADSINCSRKGVKIDTHHVVNGQIEQFTDRLTGELTPTTQLWVEITIDRCRVNAPITITRDIHYQIAGKREEGHTLTCWFDTHDNNRIRTGLPTLTGATIAAKEQDIACLTIKGAHPNRRHECRQRSSTDRRQDNRRGLADGWYERGHSNYGTEQFCGRYLNRWRSFDAWGCSNLHCGQVIVDGIGSAGNASSDQTKPKHE